VLFLHDPVDEFVMNSVRAFEGKEFISIDAEDVDVGESAKADSTLSDKEAAQLVTWLKDELASDVVDVKVRHRECSLGQRTLTNKHSRVDSGALPGAAVEAAGEPSGDGGRPRLAHHAQHA